MFFCFFVFSFEMTKSLLLVFNAFQDATAVVGSRQLVLLSSVLCLRVPKYVYIAHLRWVWIFETCCFFINPLCTCLLFFRQTRCLQYIVFIVGVMCTCTESVYAICLFWVLGLYLVDPDILFFIESHHLRVFVYCLSGKSGRHTMDASGQVLDEMFSSALCSRVLNTFLENIYVWFCLVAGYEF